MAFHVNHLLIMINTRCDNDSHKMERAYLKPSIGSDIEQ